jgi:hypothetical protein
VKTNAGHARAFSLAGFLVGFGLLAAPLQAEAELLSGVGVQTTPSIAITIPTLSVPEVPTITVPTITVPTTPLPPPPEVKVPTVPIPKPPVVTVPTVSVPKLPAVKLPTAPIPNSSNGSAAPTLPKVPSVPSPTLAGVSQAPARATSTVSGISQSSSHQGSGTTSAISAAGVYRAGGQAGLGLQFLGGGFSGPLVAMEVATARALGGLSRRGQARTAALALSSTVRRLEGCLRYLPENLRRPLELIAGVNAPMALSPEAVAAQLHLTVRGVSRLEKLALRRLRLTARTHSCAVATLGPTDSLAFGALAVLMGEEGGPAGGVKAARYASGGPDGLPTNARSQGGDPPLGINNPLPGGAGMLLILAVLAGVLSIGLLFADSLRPSPIHREWRSRWIHRHPWNRHH